MTVKSALARGRRQAQSRMLDQCAITRSSGRVLDTNTDKYTDTTTTVYSGPCRVKTVTQATQVESGQTAVEVRSYEAHIPLSTTVNVKRGDVLKVTASSDAWLIGRPLMVTDVSLGSQVTVRRLVVEDKS